MSFDSFVPVAVETLYGLGSAEIALYTGGAIPKLVRDRNTRITDNQLNQLIRAGVTTLLIATEDLLAYEHHLHARLGNAVGLSLVDQYRMLTEATRSVFESALKREGSAGVPKAVGAAKQFGKDLADVMVDQKPVLREMFDLMLHDYYSFSHAANVSTYSIRLAQEMGVSDRATLAQVATGALLHDIGKRHIPRELLEKSNKSEMEMQEIRRHPQIGFEDLSVNPDLTRSQLMMVYQHHERPDGRGYPVGVVDDEIDPWAKICAVADYFDGLTCDRGNHKALSVPDACAKLTQLAGRSFDKEIVKCLTKMLQDA
jgi:HD-GYP domain-containing protein (c-di-GMP phosphodiesterase class II)